MKVELKHLVPYLPYGLKCHFGSDDFSHLIVGIEDTIYGISLISPFNDYGTTDISSVKPILRPLSDLTKGDLDYLLNHHSTDWFVDTDFENLIIKYLEHKNLHNFIEFLPFGLVQWFIENHYDVFGLIEKNLAIDINTL